MSFEQKGLNLAGENNKELPTGINPDRVLMEKREILVPVKDKEFSSSELGDDSFSQDENNGEGIDNKEREGSSEKKGVMDRFRKWAGATALFTVVASIIANSGHEVEIGGMDSSKIKDKNRLEDALKSTSIEVFADNIESALKDIDFNFMHRFMSLDKDGNEVFNPGAFIIPFAIEVSSGDKITTGVQVKIPYEFARTFKEVAEYDLGARDEMLKKLADLIKEKISDSLIIYGIGGVTDTKGVYVYDREKNILSKGVVPVIDLVNHHALQIENIKISGGASAEAKRSVENSGPESLTGVNIENIRLAENRLGDSYGYIVEALKKTGVSDEQIKNIKSFSVEHDLSDSECAELAQISHKVLGATISGSDQEAAYILIQELNGGNTQVIKAVNNNPEYSKKIKDYITSQREVSLKFTIDGESKDSSVFNIALPLPLLLLLFPKIRIKGYGGNNEGRDGSSQTEGEMEVVYEYDLMARRIFSEKTPTNLEKERDFNDIYDSIDTSRHPEESHAMLQHLLIEEVYLDLVSGEKEPLIDYLGAVEKGSPFRRSDAGGNEIQKGSYLTTEEMQRNITKELLSMWEKHDMETYPMRGIDIKTVLNYAHSEYVIQWAKVLSEKFTEIAVDLGENYSKDTFKKKLLENIKTVTETRSGQGGASRNVII